MCAETVVMRTAFYRLWRYFHLRDRENPERFNQPSYCYGTNWGTGSCDNGGVHTNRGVQNNVFYRLSQGGTFSRYGRNITVQDLGVAAAGKIAMYVNMYLLTSTAQYDDSRRAWINASNINGFDTNNVKTAWEVAGFYNMPWFTVPPNFASAFPSWLKI